MARIPSRDRESATKEDLLGRASDLVPVLKERALETENLRQMPAENVRDIIASGLVRIGNPARYGGYDSPDFEYDSMFDVAWELGRGCGSSAWCYAVWTVHAWLTGHFPEQAQEEFWATGPDTLCSSAFRPRRGEGRAGRRRVSRFRPVGFLQRLRRVPVGNARRPGRGP